MSDDDLLYFAISSLLEASSDTIIYLCDKEIDVNMQCWSRMERLIQDSYGHNCSVTNF